MTGRFNDTDVSQFVAASKRLQYQGSKWLKAVSIVPFLGTFVRSAMDFINLRSKFRVEKTLAEAGVSNSKLFVSVLSGLVAFGVLAFVAVVLNPLEAGGSGGALIFGVLLVFVTIILLPMVASGLAVLLGTIGHALGKGERGIIRNSNLAGLAQRNIFSPKQ